MLQYKFDFEGEIQLHGVGKTRVVTYKVLFLPFFLSTELPFDAYPRLRVEGEIADVPVRGAWMPTGEMAENGMPIRYFMVPPDVFKYSDAKVGSLVEMRFRVDDQNHVDIPSCLQMLLDTEPNVARLWKALTPGKQRGFAAHVASAKTAPTQTKRLADVILALELGASTIRDLKRKKEELDTTFNP